MNILMTSQAYYPFAEKGGPVVKVRSLALGLVRLGHSVSILTSDWGFHPEKAPRVSAHKCSLGWRAEECGVTAIFLRKIGHYRNLSLNPSVLSFSWRELKRFDIVHVYGLYDLIGPSVTFFCRKNHIPYVIEPMGMFRPIVRNLRLKRIYHRLIGKPFLSAAHRMIATSEQEQRELLNEGVPFSRIVVRRNGIEMPASFPESGTFRREFEIPPGARVVLFLGRLEAKKSPELLLTAFADWRKKSLVGAAAFLIIAGPEQQRGYSARLISLASSLRIASSVRIVGPLYENRKWSAYRDADVFVLPSLNENFGNSAAEAMACGTPVIVTDQCGIASFVAGRAGLVIPHDANSLSLALSKVLDDPAACERFRSNCPAVAKSLSWDEPISQMVDVYRGALSDGSAHER